MVVWWEWAGWLREAVEGAAGGTLEVQPVGLGLGGCLGRVGGEHCGCGSQQANLIGEVVLARGSWGSRYSDRRRSDRVISWMWALDVGV